MKRLTAIAAAALLIASPAMAQIGKRSPGGWVDVGPTTGPVYPLDWERSEMRILKTLPPPNQKQVLFQERTTYSEEAKRDGKKKGLWSSMLDLQKGFLE